MCYELDQTLINAQTYNTTVSHAIGVERLKHGKRVQPKFEYQQHRSSTFAAEPSAGDTASEMQRFQLMESLEQRELLDPKPQSSTNKNSKAREIRATQLPHGSQKTEATGRGSRFQSPEATAPAHRPQRPSRLELKQATPGARTKNTREKTRSERMPYRRQRRRPPPPASDPAPRRLDRKFGSNFCSAVWCFFLVGQLQQRVGGSAGNGREEKGQVGNAGFK
jgi:hypothetical protein